MRALDRLSDEKAAFIGLLCEFCSDEPMLHHFGPKLDARVTGTCDYAVWGISGWTYPFRRVVRRLRFLRQ